MTAATRLLAGVALAAVAACGSGGPSTTPVAPPSGPTPSASEPARFVSATLGGVPLRLEVADTENAREVGLMGRDAVPPGTGMLFRFPAPSRDRFYMFHVAVPLTAVFVTGGAVTYVAQMPPCPLADPRACPTYGPDSAYDEVVETAPETLASVRVGDRFTAA